MEGHAHEDRQDGHWTLKLSQLPEGGLEGPVFTSARLATQRIFCRHLSGRDHILLEENHQSRYATACGRQTTSDTGAGAGEKSKLFRPSCPIALTCTTRGNAENRERVDKCKRFVADSMKLPAQCG